MNFDHISLPPTADFHVHLRDNAMAETVTPLIRQGGVDVAYVMPNLNPPLTTVFAVLAYKNRLQKLAPDVTFLMTLYLHPSITPQVIQEAAKAGISGVKAYPAGVTTNSQAGVLDWEQYYPVFKAMEASGLVLNLHGEAVATDEVEVSVMTAESLFLPTLLKIHKDFPRLRIVLEHCTSQQALETVKQCGPTVSASITAHHLHLTVDDVCGDVHNFCKPVAKTKVDRVALLKAAVSGNPKFFFGSDSAPHTLEAKKNGKKAPAGCFTQGWVTPIVIAAVDEGIKKGWIEATDNVIKNLEGFLSGFGRAFYGLPRPKASKKERIILERKGERIPEVIGNADGSVQVVPFKSGEEIMSLRWERGE